MTVLVVSAAALMVALAAVVWVLRRRLAVVTVVGESMLPTFSAGDRVLVRRAAIGDIRPGLVVVIEKPGAGGSWVRPPPRWPAGRSEWMIKRVAAVPGDRLPAEFRSAATGPARLPEQGERPVTLSGSCEPGKPSVTAGGSGEPTVPPGMFIVLGDNPRRSYDSRQLGYIPAERLLGVVLRPLAGAPLAVGRGGQRGQSAG